MKIITNIKLSQVNEYFDFPILDDKNDRLIPDNDILKNYLIDNIEEPNQDGEQVLEQDHNAIQDPFLLGVPQKTKEIKYQSPRQMLFDAMDNKELVSFSYTTKNGINIGKRVVEPHYTFMAKSTGNEILVSFDRSVNKIRAFIVGNVNNDGVRYEGVNFTTRPEIMAG